MVRVLRALSVVVVLLAVAIGVWNSQRKQGPPTYSGIVPRSPSPFKQPRATQELKPLAGKQCVVTGASGFLASHLVEALLDDGWEVAALVRQSSDTRVLKKLQQKFGDNKLKLLIGDVTDKESLRKAISENTPVVFHVAALILTWWKENDLMYKTNVLGTRNVVDVCLEKRVGKLVHTSTVGVYVNEVTLARGNNSVVSEESPKYAQWSYHGYEHTKYLAELEVLAGIEEGLWATMVNPAAILGKYDVTGFARLGLMLKTGQLPAMANSSLTACDGRGVANAHIAAAKHGRLGQNYLVAGSPVTVPELVDVAADELGIRNRPFIVPVALLQGLGVIYDAVSLVINKRLDLGGEIVDTASGQPLVDNRKAERELGFQCTLTPQQAMKEAMAYLKEIGHII